MKKYLIIAFLFLASYAHSQDLIHLVSDSTKVVDSSTSVTIMTKRIKDDAIYYVQYAPVPRLAEMDFAFGADLQEYEKLGGYGVLYIPSLNQDSSEYPIKRVYIKQGSEITELQKIGEISIGVTDKTIMATFGKNRVDYYYLIPYKLTQVYGELMIDWSTNRQKFVLSKFPNQNAIDFDVKKADTKNKPIDKDFLKIFLKREYNLDSN